MLSYQATIRAAQKMGITAFEMHCALLRLIEATPTAAEAMRNFGIAVRKIKKEEKK